ncbi:alkaline phosphatase family protein [Candidatus Bathyarchaeota archaeon]|nr:alkaline phosphatase family protein [Candidatus Bathyarchaeota archaeon]
MKDYHDWNSIRAVTPTLCYLLGISPPALSTSLPLADVLRISRTVFNDEKVEKCLVFAPDALGNHLYSRSPALFKEVARLAPIEVSLQSVMPSKTPVCFASMFTGAMPDQHGIRKYEKPVLQCDTLFDALNRAGKRVAIVVVRNCSIDLIFRGRDIDYYSESYDPNVTERVISLLEADRYDFILAYHQEYDDVMHATAPFAEEAIQAAKNNIAGFVQMTKAFDEHWSRYNRMIAFTPDHGAHMNSTIGKGDHGEDIPEDMEIKHFYGFRRSKGS